MKSFLSQTKFVAFSSICALVFSFSIAKAEEGMIIPSLVAAFESDMQAMGMQLSAQDIYDANNSSLKDAIIHFGGGCTAELVSSEGLLLTNYHCGYSQVQAHSSLEKDYLKNGFWAKSKSEELKNPGLTASRMVRIVDVTEDVFFGTKGLSEKDAQVKMRGNINQLIEDAMTDNHFKAQIKPFHQGNQYFMLVKETFLDVRLVGAPPSSVGKFGGDTDNWVWPRHTGDFSVFRVYAGTDNKPAKYSESNVPYSPIHFLPVSLKDRKPGDFTMVYGFPGRTHQHVVSDYLKFIMEKERPARIKMREKSLSVIDAAMKNSDDIRIKYASKQARIANAYKKWIGQIDGLRRMDAVQVKKNREKAYLEKANSKTSWKEEYGGVIATMNDLVNEKVDSEFAYSMGIEYLFVGPEYFKLARSVSRFAAEYETLENEEEKQAAKEKIRNKGKSFFKNYSPKIDKKIFQLLTKEYFRQVPIPTYSGELNIQKKADKLFAKSFLINQEDFDKFIAKFNGNKKKLQKDKGFQFWKNIYDDFFNRILPAYRAFNSQMEAQLALYVKGKLEMFPEKNHWADANSTVRITYGKLEGSTPEDGVKYTEHTSTDGILAKYNTGNSDFKLLPDLVTLFKEKDFGRYAQGDEMWVCFTGSNHTTGGNSGSPVIDANGNLIGLNFDRSWESTMSDYMFDASRCRNITVDIRYVLWIMDKYAGAKHLVDEMQLVEN